MGGLTASVLPVVALSDQASLCQLFENLVTVGMYWEKGGDGGGQRLLFQVTPIIFFSFSAC